MADDFDVVSLLNDPSLSGAGVRQSSVVRGKSKHRRALRADACRRSRSTAQRNVKARFGARRRAQHRPAQKHEEPQCQSSPLQPWWHRAPSPPDSADLCTQQQQQPGCSSLHQRSHEDAATREDTAIARTCRKVMNMMVAAIMLADEEEHLDSGGDDEGDECESMDESAGEGEDEGQDEGKGQGKGEGDRHRGTASSMQAVGLHGGQHEQMKDYAANEFEDEPDQGKNASPGVLKPAAASSISSLEHSPLSSNESSGCSGSDVPLISVGPRGLAVQTREPKSAPKLSYHSFSASGSGLTRPSHSASATWRKPPLAPPRPTMALHPGLPVNARITASCARASASVQNRARLAAAKAVERIQLGRSTQKRDRPLRRRQKRKVAIQTKKGPQSPQKNRSVTRKPRRKSQAPRKAKGRGKARVPRASHTASASAAHDILEQELPDHLREAWVLPSELGVSVAAKPRAAPPVPRQRANGPGTSAGNMNTRDRKTRMSREHSALAPGVSPPAPPVFSGAHAAAAAALNARNAAGFSAMAAQDACTAAMAAKARRMADKAEASLRAVKRKMTRQALLLQDQKSALQQYRVKEQQHVLQQSQQDEHVSRLEAKLFGAKGRLHALKMRLAQQGASQTAKLPGNQRSQKKQVISRKERVHRSNEPGASTAHVNASRVASTSSAKRLAHISAAKARVATRANAAAEAASKSAATSPVLPAAPLPSPVRSNLGPPVGTARTHIPPDADSLHFQARNMLARLRLRRDEHARESRASAAARRKRKVKSRKRKASRSRHKRISEDRGSTQAPYVCERPSTRLGRRRAEAARLLQLAEQDGELEAHELGQECGSMIDEHDVRKTNAADTMPEPALGQVRPSDYAGLNDSVLSTSDIERDVDIDDCASYSECSGGDEAHVSSGSNAKADDTGKESEDEAENEVDSDAQSDSGAESENNHRLAPVNQMGPAQQKYQRLQVMYRRVYGHAHDELGIM